MKRLSKALIASAIFLLIAALKPQAQVAASSVVADSSAALANPLGEVEKPDSRIRKLRLFLNLHRSPLEDYAGNFVTIADRYEMDWKLVPAITGVESTFGRQIPQGSYNAYGWANGAYSFESWPESIEVVTKALKEKYIDRGADTVEKIAPIYAPPSKTWAGKVRYFMGKIGSFGSEQEKTVNLELSL